MKDHVYAILAKFVIITLVLYLVLGVVYGISFSTVLLMSFILTVVSYIVGDLLILPMAAKSTTNTMTGNLIATIMDFGIALLFVWLFGLYYVSPYVPWLTAALISAVVIALGEMLFHSYLKDKILEDKQDV